MSGDFTSREEIRAVYQKRAKIYAFAVNCCYLLGFPIGRYRRLVIEALAPQPGDTIIEIGCGTGMNFPLLEEKIGAEGRKNCVRGRAGIRCRCPGWTRKQRQGRSRYTI